MDKNSRPAELEAKFKFSACIVPLAKRPYVAKACDSAVAFQPDIFASASQTGIGWARVKLNLTAEMPFRLAPIKKRHARLPGAHNPPLIASGVEVLVVRRAPAAREPWKAPFSRCERDVATGCDLRHAPSQLVQRGHLDPFGASDWCVAGFWNWCLGTIEA